MVFAPIAVISLILASLLRANSNKKKVSPKITEQQQTDELITVVLPTISNDK